MAHSLSSRKRIRQNETRRLRNRARKQRIKTETRKFDEAVHERDADRAKALYVGLAKLVDQTAAKGTMHRNTAARRKSRLAKKLNKIGTAAS